MEFLQKAILQTLIYADIFDYPLTAEELYRFLITKKTLSFSSFNKVLIQINADSKLIDADRGYFFLKGREKIVNLRRERKKWSWEKMKLLGLTPEISSPPSMERNPAEALRIGWRRRIKIARRVGKWFRLIPWIKMVGVTGALAMENSNKNDDIDLAIVTAKNRLWLTRFFLVLLTEILGVRRRPQDKAFKNKICLNMFFSEDHLAMPAKERNLFTSHEVCQVKLVWDKNETYKKFLDENRWVRKFLPNAVKISSKFTSRRDSPKGTVQSSKFQFDDKIFDFLEEIAYKFQLDYMKPKRTIEKVSQGRVLFHPQDCSGWVLEKYFSRVKKTE